MGRIAKIAAAALMCLLLMFGTALPFSFSLLEKQQTSSQATFSGDGVEEICWNYLVGKGLSEQAAAGILGNMKQESTFDTSADNGTHHGLCQWGGGRLTGLKAYAEARGKDVDDVEVQLSYLWCEITDEEDSGIERGYASNQWCNGYDLDDLKNASSPTEAAEIFGVAIERFGAGETGARHTYAEELYEAHKGQSASSSASSKTSSSSRSEYGWGCVGQGASKTSGSSELARRYVELAKSGEMFGCSAGMCEAWVEEVLRNVEGIDAGQVARMCCATGAWEAWGVSTSRDGIPLGANVYGYSNPSAGGGCHSDYGHVAIYIGDGQVISNEGGVATTRDLFGDGGSWEAVFGYRGWGWCGGIDLSSANGELVDIARSKIGLTYHIAAQGTCPSGTPPSGTSGEEYDCSGLVDEALSEAGWAGFGSKGSHGPNSTALLDYAKQNWEKVDEGDVSDGDIAFFINPAKDWTCTHVAICTSSGSVIEAAGDEYHDAKVQESDIWTFPGGYNEYYRPSR